MEGCLLREFQYGTGICFANTAFLHIADVDPELLTRLVLSGQIVLLAIRSIRIRHLDNHLAGELAILALDSFRRSDFANTFKRVLVGVERLLGAVLAERWTRLAGTTLYAVGSYVLLISS